MNKYTVYKNDNFKTMFDVETEKVEWKYGYMIYAQEVEGRIFVTFFKKDYTEKAHFNDSGSIDLRLYIGGKKLREMIETAISLGWVQ